MFSLIGAQFLNTSINRNTKLVIMNAVACLVQSTLQTVFILDATRRYASTPEQVRFISRFNDNQFNMIIYSYLFVSFTF